ncbi:MAG: undecaprenyl-phosphate glucose phosphotransferase [Pseudomonas fluorescens]|nr:MAG: undecaprenyl-phosphate glucose phosphotransferase [Pseudomonas fluorescens]
MLSSYFQHPGVGSIRFMLRAIEPLLIIICSVAAYLFHVGPEMYSSAVALTLVAASIFGIGAGALKLYEDYALRNLINSIPRLFTLVFLTFGSLLILLFLFKISAQFSRVWLILWSVSFMASVLGLRWWAAWTIKQSIAKGLWKRRMAVLGCNDKAVELVKELYENPQPDVEFVGVFCVSPDMDYKSVSSKLEISCPLPGGSFDKLLKLCAKGAVDDVVIAENLEKLDHASNIFLELNSYPINAWYCLPLGLIGRMSLTGGLPLVLIFKRPLEGHSVLLKRAIDVLASGMILTMIAPVMLVVALLVKMSSPGPIFFRQQRGGFNGEEFEMLKFRSMREGSDAVKDENGKEMQALKNDPRVTWIGKIIRKTSLDELPQLINVLRGDMSLVGPRPHVPSHNNYYENLIDVYASRHKMKPGLTGWAQLNGLRGETETLEKMEKRVEFDIWYTQNWSFWMDVKIILMTPFTVLFQKTAY